MAGLLIALAGVWLLLRADRFRLEEDLLAGDLLTLVNSVSYGLFLVVSKRYLAEHDPLAATAHVFAIGAIGVALYGLPELRAVEVAQLSPQFYLCAAFIVLIPTVGAYFLVFWALRRTRSSLVALFIYVQPLIATLLDAAVRGEWPGWRFYPAAALVFIGVGLGARQRQGRAETVVGESG
jgi:drug/metabolite transporter (DMT)-like permease